MKQKNINHRNKKLSYKKNLSFTGILIMLILSCLLSGCKKESAALPDTGTDANKTDSFRPYQPEIGKTAEIQKGSTDEIENARNELIFAEDDKSLLFDKQNLLNEKTDINLSYNELVKNLSVNGDAIDGRQKEILESVSNKVAMLHYGMDGLSDTPDNNGRIITYYYDSLSPEQEAFFIYKIFDDNKFLNDYFGYNVSYESGILNKDDISEILSYVFPYGNLDFWNYSPLFRENGPEEIEMFFGDGEPWFEFRSSQVFFDGDYYLLKAPILYGDNGGGEYFTGYMNCIFQRSEESLLGALLLFSELEYRRNSNLAISAEATSNLPAASGKTYIAGNLVDGNFNTAWCEGVEGNGEGERISLSLGDSKEINGLVVYNGYLASGKLYNANGKARIIRVRTGGIEQIYDVNLINPSDSDTPLDSDYTGTVINFDYPVIDSEVIITLESVSLGTKYQDTCISEIQVY